MDELSRRIDELEIRYAYQGRMVEELNLVVAECNQRIASLEKELARSREMFKALAPGLSESPDE